MKKGNFLHKLCLTQKKNYPKSAYITTNLICNKTEKNAQKTKIVHKMPNSNIKFQIMPKKNPPKRAKLHHYSLSLENRVKFCKDLTPYKGFFTPTLLTRFFHLWFQHIPDHFSLFQPCSAFSSLFQPIQDYAGLFQPFKAYSILFQPIPAYSG